MPASTTEIDFANGVAEVLPIGQKSKVRFVFTWADGDYWSAQFVGTLSKNFTVGKGNIAGQTFTCAFKLRNRMYLGFGSDFAMSSVGDVTLWEEQNAGAGVINYVSQFGSQDSVKAFAALQSRVAVFGTNTLQIWQSDADPRNFALLQTMDNAGTIASESVQSIGDSDVFYLDRSGIRSLRAKEYSNNGQVNDIGTAIDLTIRQAITSGDYASACAIIEPVTKQYWLFLVDKFYVLSYYPQSKIVAWATFTPTISIAPSNLVYTAGAVEYITLPGLTYTWTKGAGATNIQKNDATVIRSTSGTFVATENSVIEIGTTGTQVTSTLVPAGSPFVPEKMIVLGNQVYIRTTQGLILNYGGGSNASYDCSQATIELPWLQVDQKDGKECVLTGLQAAFRGEWTFSMGNDTDNPSALTEVFRAGDADNPDIIADSTYDNGRYEAVGNGTHVKVKIVSSAVGYAALLSKLGIQFNLTAAK